MVLQTRISHTIFLGCDGLAQVLTSEKKISLMYTQTLRGVLTVLNHHRPLCERLDESGRPRGPAHHWPGPQRRTQGQSRLGRSPVVRRHHRQSYLRGSVTVDGLSV